MAAGAAGVQAQGCALLGNLCRHADNVKRMQALTVREVVERARAVHPANGNLQAWAEDVLGKLA